MNMRVCEKIMIFRGMTREEIDIALMELHGEEAYYQKGQAVFLAGNVTQKMGLVLDGSVTIENNDMWGNRTILSYVGEGQLFAETYAILKEESMLVDVVANENCHILFLNMAYLHTLNLQSGTWTAKLITNLLTICAHKNLLLSNRSFHTAPKTIRGRVMAYLNSVALQKNSREFDIPFNRQQLADYLNLERSALSKEIGKMQREGIITSKKNHFIIQGNPETL